MESKIISGREISKCIMRQLKIKTEHFFDDSGRRPQLALIAAGNNRSQLSYVKGIENACGKIGMQMQSFLLDESADTKYVLSIIGRLNEDKNTDGILVEFPLLSDIDEFAVCNAVDPDKDIDGITVKNAGNFYRGLKCYIPCTAKSILYLVKYTGISISGKHAVVIGRSNIVGKPAAALLLKEDATVTICHSKTRNLKGYMVNADIIVSAAGVPSLIKHDMIKEGAIVIDAGTSIRDGKLTGDVEFEEACRKASWITPVPGGVGPVTCAMLLENTLEAAVK
ncbi:MAG: bifunctional 5,10-methylenetetrahydrofolate dehydrogenase/5,10-methenyltetrahydrofolate cyclohydrolase [Clostridiales bacterium]|nr:bifunctional 5,10-methylenetetrahydrofolate dehydrogenase/5,10-methenyltetrahydrofolate cyclohydrolase [Clostridiales bacterium]